MGSVGEHGDNLIDARPRLIGASGLESGPLAFGSWRFVHEDTARAQQVLEAALGAGMTLVDVADVYGLDWGGSGFGAVEAAVGRVLAVAPTLRDQIVLATKGGIRPPVPYDSGPRALREACEGSLRRLGVDTIDLYQVHRPDLFTHPAEVAATLAALHHSGKVREVGVSNHTASQTDALAVHLREAGLGLASIQPELSVAHLDPLRDGTLDLAQRDGVAVLAWSPLAGGRVATGEGLRPELVSALDRLAEREGVDRAAIALAFVLAHPSRPVAIVGTQRPERLAEAARASRVHLDRRDVYDLIEASEGKPLP